MPRGVLLRTRASCLLPALVGRGVQHATPESGVGGQSPLVFQQDVPSLLVPGSHKVNTLPAPCWLATST